MPLEIMIPIKALRALIALERPIQPPPQPPHPHPHPAAAASDVEPVAVRHPAVRQVVGRVVTGGVVHGVHELVVRGLGGGEEGELRAGGVDVGHYGAGERGERVGVWAVWATSDSASSRAGGGGW